MTTDKLSPKMATYILLIIFLLTMLVVFPSIPLFGNLPTSDSAGFIYIAKKIMKGKILYVDLFENKSPGISLINIIGLLLDKKSFWGIWILEYLAISSAAWLGFLLMKKKFGIFPATTATILWLLSLVFLYTHGNTTEFYGIFFQFLALYFFIKTETKGKHLWKFFFIGCATAGSFLLRINLIGIYLIIFASMLYMLLKNSQKRKYLLQICSASGGIFFCLLPWIIYFYFNNALGEAFSAAFLSNIYYSESPILNKAGSAIGGLYLLSTTGITIYASIALLLGSIAFVKKDKYFFKNKLLLIATIDLPLEMILSSLSGRIYSHYYAPWLPSLAILTAFFFQNQIYLFNKTTQIRNRIIRFVIYPLVLITLISLAIIYSYRALIYNLYISKEYNALGKMINRTTKKDDNILVWGMGPTINLTADRTAIGKYILVSPLFLRNYSNPAIIKNYHTDITENPPKYIIDVTPLRGSIPPLNKDLRSKWIPDYTVYKDFKEFKDIYSFVDRSYNVSISPETGWRIYKLKRQI